MSNREIIIRIQLPRTLRKRWLIGGGVGVMLAGVVAYAAVTWPASHTPGTKISAADLDGYLNDLDSRIKGITAPRVFTALALQNGWSASPLYNTPGYAKTADGFVHLRGNAKAGTL